MRKPLIHIVIATLAALATACCSESLSEPQLDHQPFASHQSVRSKSDAVNLALIALGGYDGESHSASRAKEKEVSSFKIYSNGVEAKEADEKSVYVINFKEGGFALIPANNYIGIPLGISDTGVFAVCEDDENSIGRQILGACYSYIGGLIGGGDTISVPIDRPVREFVIHNGIECYRTRSTVPYGSLNNHLVSTLWDQGDPYNYYCPMDTNYTLFDYRSIVGCVPLAIAQIMAYHRFPASYSGQLLDWDAILALNHHTSITDIGALDIALFVHNLGLSTHVVYHWNSTTTSFEYEGPRAFYNAGYTCAQLESYSFSRIKDEIDNNRPVAVNGHQITNSGHVWVIDGYYHTITTLNYYSITTDELLDTEHAETRYVHCNWGAGGREDGNFVDGLFRHLNHDWNCDLCIIYNIFPPSNN